MLLMLDNQKVQLAHLTTIFQALITQSVPTTQQGTVVMNSVKPLRMIVNAVHLWGPFIRQNINFC